MFNKLRGKYSRKKAKKLNREVISYEDVVLDNYEEETTKISSVDAKKIIKIIIILLALGLIVFAFANRNSLTPENISNWFKYDVLGQGDGKGYPVDIVGTSVDGNNFFTNSNDVAYVSDTSFVSLSSNASVIQNTQLNSSNAVLVNSGSNTLIYGLGSKSYQIGSLNSLSFSDEMENNIFVGDINNHGDYALVTQVSGYLSKLYVYNKDHKQIYAYSFADYYINAIALNSSGTGCVACGISADSGSLQGMAYLLDFGSEEPVQTFPLPENAIYRAEYLGSNQVCLIGNTSSYVLDVANKSLNENKYDQKTLTAYSVNEDTGSYAISLSRSGDGHSCTMQFFDNTGKMTGTCDTDLQITSMSLFKGRVAVLDNDTAYLYDLNGTKIGEKEAGNGSKQIRMSSSSSAYILGVNEIREINF